MIRLFKLLTITGVALYAGLAFAALTPSISAKNVRDFTRVTFNWPEKIRFRVEPQKSGVTLIFSQPTNISASQMKSRLGSILKGSTRSGDGTKVTLTFDKPYRVRHFISGNSNGIDIIGASISPPKEPPKPKPKPKKTNKPSEDKKPTALTSQPLTTIEPEKPAQEKPVTPPVQPTEPAPANIEVTQVTKELKPEPIKKEAPEKPIIKEAVKEIIKETVKEPTATKTVEKPKPVHIAKPKEKIVKKEQKSLPPSAQNNPFLITTYALATGTEIRFPWIQRTAASVFTRGEDVIWVVFSNEQFVNMKLLRSILPASVLDIQEVDIPGHLALRMQTDGTVHPRLHQPKNTAQWWLTLSRYEQIPSEIIELDLRSGGTISDHIYVPELQYDKPVTFVDPNVGDEITVVPFYTPGRGIYPARNFPQVNIMQSAQGVAMIRKDDFAEVRQLRNGFRITSRDGISLSDDLPELKLAELESLSGSITWFPYSAWAVDTEDFISTRRDLEAKLADASDVRANSIRLKMAQLYLGFGMGNEALAWLQLIEESNPSFFKERDLVALRGAAYFINDKYMRAKQAFNDEALRGESELKLWQQALSVFEEERSRFDYEAFYQTYISKYPPKMREKLAILAADNYINRRSYNRAFKTLNSIAEEENLSPRTESYIYFLLGKVAAETENIDGAKKLWEPLIEAGAPRFVRATTQFALTSMLYNNGEITLKQAIDRIESVRIVWRGDALEMTMLNYLGQLYMEDNNHLMALRTWNELVQNFADAPLAISVAGQMANAFNNLYAQGGAEKLTPLDALSIFYEFRQLTPIGVAGDTMIQELADRLMAVDLLDRAAALIEHQIKFRQEKLPRSKLGTQLAMIYLMDGKPKNTIETLELTGFGKMPEEMSIERRRIAAMAMSELGETKRAIKMIANDDSREADRLRLHLYWNDRSWSDVIFNAERLLGNRPDVTAPLTDEETEQLLQLSIAYMFDRNTVQLQYLHNYFMPLLKDGPNKDIFDFVANASGPIDPQKFNQLTKDISSLEGFIKSYKKQVEDGGISPILN